VRSPSDVAKFASLFCDNDNDLAMEWIAAGISELGTYQSPSTPGYLTLSVASPLRRASPLPFRVSRGLGDWAEEVVDEETPVPEDVGLSDAVALLRGVFGEPPYAAHLRCLRIMLKTFGDESSVADISRLLQPLSPDQLHGIAALLGRELPSGKWNAAVRGSKVISMLAQLCSAIFKASAAVSPPVEAVGRGGGGGGGLGEGEGRPSPSGDVSDVPRRSAPPSPAPSLASRGSRRGNESTRDIAARHEAARKLQPKQLMIKSLPGIFCAGEMLDWEAPTGGYLINGAMASGKAAAVGVNQWLSD
jgi:hypothetical protein